MMPNSNIDLSPVEYFDTGVSNDAPLAGETIQIFCTVAGLAEMKRWATVRDEILTPGT